MLRILMIVVMAGTLLSGCGGGGGGDAGTAIPAVSAVGSWEGTVTDGSGYTFDVLGIVAPDNEVRIFSISEGVQYKGNIRISGDSATGTFTGYAPDGYVFANNSPVTSGTVSLTVQEKATIRGSYSSPGDNGTISLTYDAFAERQTSLQEVVGRWGYNFIGDWVDMTIASGGTLTGSDNDGCQYTGTISLPNPAWDIFDVTLNASQCGVYDGTYTGLAVFDDSDPASDYLLVMVSNGQYSVLEVFEPL